MKDYLHQDQEMLRSVACLSGKQLALYPEHLKKLDQFTKDFKNNSELERLMRTRHTIVAHAVKSKEIKETDISKYLYIDNLVPSLLQYAVYLIKVLGVLSKHSYSSINFQVNHQFPQQAETLVRHLSSYKVSNDVSNLCLRDDEIDLILIK